MKLSKLGEDVTETLEVIPRQWKVIQTVREKFTCRACEAISQPPAPFHVTPRGFVGPNLLAMVLFEKFGQHQPLNRQSERYGREGIDLPVSTLADQVGAATAALAPLHERIARHVMAAERLHDDDTCSATIRMVTRVASLKNAPEGRREVRRQVRARRRLPDQGPGSAAGPHPRLKRFC